MGSNPGTAKIFPVKSPFNLSFTVLLCIDFQVSKKTAVEDVNDIDA